MMVLQHGGTEKSHVVDQFEATDLGAPFKVVLHNAVKVTTDAFGNMLQYTIPDLEGLFRVVAMARLMHQRKLSGDDIKFMRKVAGLKQKELASRIYLDPVTLSRIESSKQAISPQSEKLLRVYVLRVVLKLHAAEPTRAKLDLECALDEIFDRLMPVAAHVVGDKLELHFRRGRCPHCDQAGSESPDCDVALPDWERELELAA